MKVIVLTVLAAAVACGQSLTTVSGRMQHPATGNWANCSLTVKIGGISASAFGPGGQEMSPEAQLVTRITNGYYSFAVAPNDQITPNTTYYTATFTQCTEAPGGMGWVDTLFVPTSASPVAIASIHGSPIGASLPVSPQQLSQDGATIGQGLFWNGMYYAPGNQATLPDTATWAQIESGAVGGVVSGTKTWASIESGG